jgi:alkylation response protein AidB-like acyl-CoA dehydrogenase
MSHYKSNIRDIEFTLFEVLGRRSVYGTGPYADMDVDTARSVLEEVNRLATHELAEPFTDSDRHPPIYDPTHHTVTLPEGLKRSFEALMNAEWFRLDLPPALGGLGAPPSLRWAAQELILGANPACHLYSSGPNFAAVIWQLGTAKQQALARTMIDHRWGATMVLTEPDAGSDVGAGRTRATPNDDGTWRIEGVKRFITSGEHDLSDNIVHLVLARPEGAGPGTKGLSLFIVPKFLSDWTTGELAERNGVYATNLEKKMGLKGSATCELTFGVGAPAVGWLLGDVHDGIAQMFTIIEYARMLVGTKAISTLSTGYLNALDYAKTRVQGADMTQMTDKAAPRVTITHHPDVRRSLMLQKSYAEGMRALVLYTATVQDTIEESRGTGTVDDRAVQLNDLLLPIVKGFGSERSYEQLAQSLQILGGSGYLQDYPHEQYLRDAKIDTLYEGTTAIQGIDLFFRKIVKDQGHALTGLLADIQEFAKGGNGTTALATERQLLADGLDQVQLIVGSMVSSAAASATDPTEIYRVGLNTTRLLFCLGDLVTSWLLLRQADVALTALDHHPAERDIPFYQGKVAAATFFARTILPTLSAARVSAELADGSLMELPEDAF